MKQYKKLILVVCVFIVCMVITVLAIVLLKTDWQFISDQNKANNFTPTNDIKDIADNLTLTERGRVVFYASSPTLMAGEFFNKECNNYGSDVYIAGCYYEDTNRDEHIVIYDVGSSVLEENGISYDFSSYRRIVALHEFLHAIWARLSGSAKDDACNGLSTIIYQIPRLQEELSAYDNEAFLYGIIC